MDRDQFEAWFRTELGVAKVSNALMRDLNIPGEIVTSRHPPRRDRYFYNDVQDMWRAWSGAHKSPVFIALRAVAEAAREMREATLEYERVSQMELAEYPDDVTSSGKWEQASRAQLQAERDLDAALEALAKVES